ncbi:MAG: hypothetical protein WC625_04555 [Caldisericia bacterium]
MTEQGSRRHVVLRGRFDTARILPGLSAVHVAPVQDPRMRGSAASAVPIGTAVIDLVSAVLFSFASNPATYRRVEALYQRDAQRFGLLASKSPLLGHPLFGRLTGIAAATARHLLGLFVYESVDPAFASSVDRLVERSWHRAWTWVANHERVNVGDFMAANHIPPRTRDELDAECVVLVWQAGRVGRTIVPSPELQALRDSLLSWSVLMALESMRPASPPPPVPHRDAASYFGAVWSRVVGQGSVGDFARVGARVMELANALLQEQVVSLSSADSDLVQAACDTLAGRAPRSGDEEAALALAWLVAMGQVSRAAHEGDRVEELGAQVQQLREALKTEEHRVAQFAATVTALERSLRQTNAELASERARVQRRDAEIMGLREQADATARRNVPQDKAVSSVEERLLVAGGSQALARRLAAWMPRASFTTEDQMTSLDASMLHGCAAAVILTSHISHAMADAVAAEARRQGIPVILVGWSNTSRIARAVREALDRRY